MHSVGQFVSHLTARVTPDDEVVAHQTLPRTAWALFDGMPVADRRHGLDVWDVRRIPIHGGTIRVSVCHHGRRRSTPAVADIVASEQAWGVATPEPYLRFARAVGALRFELLELLEQLRANSGSLAAYGAAAKGVTLLSYCGVGAVYLDFVVDRSTYKQGKRYPVDALPIYAPSVLVERQPAYTLLLTWNFAAEVLRQQDSYVRLGGRFVIPVPTPRVVPTGN